MGSMPFKKIFVEPKSRIVCQVLTGGFFVNFVLYSLGSKTGPQQLASHRISGDLLYKIVFNVPSIHNLITG